MNSKQLLVPTSMYSIDHEDIRNSSSSKRVWGRFAIFNMAGEAKKFAGTHSHDLDGVIISSWTKN